MKTFMEDITFAALDEARAISRGLDVISATTFREEADQCESRMELYVKLGWDRLPKDRHT